MRLATIYMVAVVLFASTGNAHAYLDPGTGAILLQGAIGAIAGALFVAKSYWWKIKTLLGFSSDEAVGTERGADQARPDEAR